MPLSELQKRALALLAKDAKVEPMSSSKPLKAFSTGSIVLDALTGIGGLPRGRVVEISGLESSGKSTFAQVICGVAQQQGFRPVYIDIEQTFDVGYARKLRFELGTDADPKALLFQPKTIEEATEIVRQFAPIPETGIIVLDSVASARTQKELDGSEQIGLHSRAVAEFVNVATKGIAQSDVLLIGVNQNRMKMEKVGGQTIVTQDVAGGLSWKYACTCRFELRICGGEKGLELNPLTGKEEDVRVSNRVRIRTLKNKAGVPYRTGEIVIRFGEGIDNLTTILELAEAYKVIEKSANGYFKYDSKKKKERNFTDRGTEAVRQRLQADKALVQEIVDAIGLDRILANQASAHSGAVVSAVEEAAPPEESGQATPV